MHDGKDPPSLKDPGQFFPCKASNHDEDHHSKQPAPDSSHDVSPGSAAANQHKPMPKEPFFLEICTGSARVTTCLQSLGLSASFGVDHRRQKHAGYSG